MDKQRGTEPTLLQAFQLCSRCRVPECGILLRNILSSVSARCAGSPACAQSLTVLGKPAPASWNSRSSSWNSCSASCSSGMLRVLASGRAPCVGRGPSGVEQEQRKSRERRHREPCGGSAVGGCCCAASLLECPLSSQPLAST